MAANLSHPLDRALAELDDYVRRVMPEERLDAYEANLFERAFADQAPELALRSGLQTSLREMKARGTLDLWLTPKQVDALGSLGLKIAYYELDLQNPKPPRIDPGDDLLVTKIPVDLSGIKRLEAEVLTHEGRLLKRMPDIGFDPSAGAIYACCEVKLAMAAASVERVTRLYSVEDGSQRRLLLEIQAL